MLAGNFPTKRSAGQPHAQDKGVCGARMINDLLATFSGNRNVRPRSHKQEAVWYGLKSLKSGSEAADRDNPLKASQRHVGRFWLYRRFFPPAARPFSFGQSGAALFSRPERGGSSSSRAMASMHLPVILLCREKGWRHNLPCL